MTDSKQSKRKYVDWYLIPKMIRFVAADSEDMIIKPNRRIYYMELFGKLLISFAVTRQQ